MSLLSVDKLCTELHSDDQVLRLVEDVSFDIGAGEFLGLVGESGCGKSLTALSIIQLLPQPHIRLGSGSVRFNGRELSGLSPAELAKLRGNDISIIFQDPMTALNPVHTVGRQIIEVLEIHGRASGDEARKEAIALMEKVGIHDADTRIDDHPHKFSGGMRQRIMIAIALACKPKLLIADEPTTALDVTIQAEIMALIQSLQAEYGMAVLFITHDLSLVAQHCERVAVMYAGRIIEQGEANSLFRQPRHPYTKGLVAALPGAHRARKSRINAMPGQVPHASEFSDGCRFANRCDYATEQCQQTPPMRDHVACWHWEEIQ